MAGTNFPKAWAYMLAGVLAGGISRLHAASPMTPQSTTATSGITVDRRRTMDRVSR